MKTVSSEKIKELYQKFVLNNSNWCKSDLPFEKNDKRWKWEGKDFPRVIAILEFEKYVKKYNLSSKNLLTFNSYDDPEVEYLPTEGMTNFNYEEDIVNYDLHTLNIPKSDYDFVMLNQTLEHLYNPYLCLDNIKKHLANEAYIYCNVPTINIQHSLPNNFYTGFTPIGLAVMFESCEFEVLEIVQWGNFEYISRIFSTHSWPDYRMMSSYANEINNPVQCWALAKNKK
jgi:hypothetical protein